MANNASGIAYLFTSANGIWSPAPGMVFNDPDATGDDFFGYSVALSGDGSTALIGAPGDSSVGASYGEAYVFTQVNGLWATTPTATSTLVDPQPVIYDAFGTSVALSSLGTVAFIGAPQTPGVSPPPPNNTPTYGGPGQAYAVENSNGWGYSGGSGASASGGGGGALDWLCSAAFLTLLLRRKRAGHRWLY